MGDQKLPELPEPATFSLIATGVHPQQSGTVCTTSRMQPLFTVDQIHAYARAAIEQAVVPHGMVLLQRKDAQALIHYLGADSKLSYGTFRTALMRVKSLLTPAKEPT